MVTRIIKRITEILKLQDKTIPKNNLAYIKIFWTKCELTRPFLFQLEDLRKHKFIFLERISNKRLMWYLKRTNI